MINPHEGKLLQPKEELNYLQEFINEANEHNDKTWKIQALEQHEECKAILWWVYNPMITFGITSKQVKKKYNPIEIHATVHKSIHYLLSDLADRELTGYAALKAVNAFIIENADHARLIYRIIDRNLQTRTGAKLINKVYPNLIPSFDVALAQKYEKFEKRIDWINEDWYASRKLDGIRCLIKIKNRGTNIRFYSRKGHEFFTLGKLKDELKIKLAGCPDIVLDGEICIVDENGVENFQNILSEVSSHNHIIERPKFLVFDRLLLLDFEAAKSSILFKDRQQDLQSLFVFHEFNYMEYVAQILIKDIDLFKDMREKAVENGWEGLMLRKNALYQGKRSNDLLKAKFYEEAEYYVQAFESDYMRVVDNGQEVKEKMLSSVTILHKGFMVSVGSGFSKEQRRKYYAHPELILGAMITVKYFEETTNDNDTISLRFPVVKAIFESEKREI